MKGKNMGEKEIKNERNAPFLEKEDWRRLGCIV